MCSQKFCVHVPIMCAIMHHNVLFYKTDVKSIKQTVALFNE